MKLSGMEETVKQPGTDRSMKCSEVGGLTAHTGEVQKRSLRAALKAGERYLTECGIEDVSVDAWLLLEYVTGMTRTVFLAEGGQEMSEEDDCRYRELLRKRGSHIPLQHLTGEQEFMGLSFLVNEHVLIPRQDTEILVEEALKRLRPGMRALDMISQHADSIGALRLKPGMHVLDMCTGSGCIAISLAKLCGVRAGGARENTEWSDTRKEAAKTNGVLAVDAADISEEALAVATENASRLEADVRFIHSDLFSEIIGKYDMIVSNPPYIRSEVIEALSEEVRCHEPRQALDGKADGLHFYREIVRESKSYLKENGWLLFEIGYDQAEQVTSLMSRAGFVQIEVVRDLAGLDRVVLGRWPG